MTNAELKTALQNRSPVICRSSSYGETKYKRIYAIRYTLDKAGKVIIQAELMDKNENSIKVVNASEVFLDE